MAAISHDNHGLRLTLRYLVLILVAMIFALPLLFMVVSSLKPDAQLLADTLAVTPDARAWLAERGYDPVFGARPLRRLIQNEVQNRLASALLSGRVHDGDVVRVDVAADGSSLVLTSDGPGGPAPSGAGPDDGVIEAELLDE